MIILTASILTLFVVVLAKGGLSVQSVEAAIESLGPWGVVGSIGLMVVHSFVPFPAELVAIANGMVYGPLWGTLITWFGAMLGAYLAFGLARYLGRPFVVAMVARRGLARLEHWTDERAAALTFLGRLVPVISFNLINYVAGLTGMSWWTFGWTTGLGILPLTIAMVAFGDQVETLAWYWWLVLPVIGLIAWWALRRLIAR